MNELFEETFLLRPLRTPGRERGIGGSTFRGKRCLEITLIDGGAKRGGLQVRTDAAPLIAQAIELARQSTTSADVGKFRDGRFEVVVTTGPNRHCPAVLLQKVDGAGVNAGGVVVLSAEDFDAVEAGIAWLFSQETES